MPGFSSPFNRLGAAHAAVMAQRQEAIATFLPPVEWALDLAAGTYTQGGITLRVSLLGSYAERSRTWLWAWANAQFGEDHPAVRPTLEARSAGSRLALPEFGDGETDLSWYEGPARHAGDLIAMAAGGLLDVRGVVPFGYDGGVGYLATHDPAVPAAGWDPVTAPRLIMSGITLFPDDHRLTVMKFFSNHCLPYREEAASVVAELPGGGLCVAEFDDHDRFARLSMNVAAVAGGPR